MSSSAFTALSDLFVSMFSVGEMRRFVRYEYPELYNDIAFQGSPASVAFEVVATLDREGALAGSDLFDALVRERPRRKAEIRAVQGAVAGASAPDRPVARTPLGELLERTVTHPGAESGLLRRLGLQGVEEDLPQGAGIARVEALAAAFTRRGVDRDEQLYQGLLEVAPDQRATIFDAAVEVLGRPLDVTVRPFGVRKAEISNFRGIDRLEVDFDASTLLDGRWTCVAGINGAGKSSVVQAIVLALLGHPRVMELGDGLLQRMRRRSPSIRTSFIRLTLDDGREISLSIGKKTSGSDAGFWSEPHIPILAFGASRNLIERAEGTESPHGLAIRRVLGLFRAGENGPSSDSLLGLSDRARAHGLLLLRQLVDVVFDGQLTMLFETPPRFRVAGDRVEALDLPDGYRSAIAWLAEVCFAWADHTHEPDARLDAVRAIVVVDELDLHLHPSLQRTLVPRLRKALPGVQWIVTTHSPLLLSSFDRNELVLLDRDEARGVRVVDRQIYGFSANEVYRYLMGVEPTAAALEDRLAVAAGGEADLLAEALLSSPTRSASDARRLLARRQELLAALKNRSDE